MIRVLKIFMLCLMLHGIDARAMPIAPLDIINVGGREWAQVDLFGNLSWAEISAVCPGGVCGSAGTLNSFNMEGWIWASVTDVNALFNTYLSARGIAESDLLDPVLPDSYNELYYGLPFDPFFSAGWRRTFISDGFGSPFYIVDGWSSTTAEGPLGAFHPNYTWNFNKLAGFISADTSRDDSFPPEAGYPQIPDNQGAWFYRASGTVPVPGTFFLFGLGLLGAAFTLRKM